MLSDSEDEDAPPTPRETLHSHDLSRTTSRAESIDQDEEAMRKTKDAASNVPLHPIPAMQSAFTESLVEATADPPVPKPKLRFGDAKERRGHLIDSEKDAQLYNELWRYRPEQTHHELCKLMAQISFGVYLLLNGIANSNIQVVNILQGHIDEVDEFLEVAMEDVKLATEDITERIDFLQLPMQNITTFEKMLEDRAFRLQIVTGNEKIEHIVSRTAAALEAGLGDIDQGLKATKQFAVYLGDQQNRPWRAARPDVVDIFDAMKGNAEGWYKAFVDLQASAAILDNLLVKLGQMVADMDRRAGEVSRRTTVSPMSGAYSLSLRASALMPLQFNMTADSPHIIPVLSPQTSRKSSQRSSSSRAHSASLSSRTESLPAETRSPSQKSTPSSPNVRDTLPDFQFKPLQIQRRSSGPKRGPILEIDTAREIEEELMEPSRPSPIEEEGLFLLQPRTYTPQPPAPLPSPMVHNLPSKRAEVEISLSPMVYRPPTPKSSPKPPVPDNVLSPLVYEPPTRHSPKPSGEQPSPASPQQEQILKRTSLRQRLSLKGSHPPESIQVPPRNVNRPKHQSPRVQYAQQVHVPDLAYASDAKNRPPARSNIDMRAPIHSMVDPRPPMHYRADSRPSYHSTTDLHTPSHSMADTLQDFPSPPVFQYTIPSPLSDQQYFRPVQASPHSPLQRPWTSGPTGNPRPHTSATQYQHAAHHRNAPSAMGMSTLSNVTTMNTEGKNLKKKRSAFGWLKKAFALDEEERAAFETRKQKEAPNLYYEGRSPKYLDGRRREDYRRY